MTDAYELAETSEHVVLENQLPKPRILFGAHTSAPYAEVSSATLTVQEARYAEDFPCFHMTVESFDLHSKIRAARTFFLGKNCRFEHDLQIDLDDYNVPQQYTL